MFYTQQTQNPFACYNVVGMDPRCSVIGQTQNPFLFGMDPRCGVIGAVQPTTAFSLPLQVTSGLPTTSFPAVHPAALNAAALAQCSSIVNPAINSAFCAPVAATIQTIPVPMSSPVSSSCWPQGVSSSLGLANPYLPIRVSF